MTCEKCQARYIHGSCFKCKALNRNGTCQLGYKKIDGRPAEPCPKPTTYLSLMDCKE